MKASLGDPVAVWADVCRDGHDVLGAAVRYRRVGTRRWKEAPLLPTGTDRWHGRFVHVPITLATGGRNQVDPNGDLWMSVLEATGQPERFC